LKRIKFPANLSEMKKKQGLGGKRSYLLISYFGCIL